MNVAAYWPLWLLLALPWFGWVTWRYRNRASSRRLIVAAALRGLALILLAAALMQPTVAVRNNSLSVVYAVDISRSISPRGIEETLRWIEQTGRGHPAAQSRLVLFGSRARLVQSAAEARGINVADQEDVHGAIGQGATNLEEALLASLDGFRGASEKHLVLLSDGNQTAGDVFHALSRMQREGVHVYAIPARPAAQVDAWPELIQIGTARAQQPVQLSVRVFSRTTAEASVRLEVDGSRAATRRIRLEPGINAVVFESRFPRPGACTVAVEVKAAGDEIARNDRLQRSVWVGPRPRIVHAEGKPDSAHYLADALRRESIDVITVSPERLAQDEALLRNADVLVLSDVAAAQLAGAIGERIERFVRDRGGALVFAAGEQTYGKEGYAGSAIERTLPISFEARRKRRDIDLVLLIDRSYSMRGRKLELAKTAALATLDLLEEDHRLAVIGFDAQPREVVPLSPVGNKRRAEDLVASMTASGQTSLYPALRKAQQLLADSTAATRHIILLSDGITAPPQGRSASSAEQVQAMLREARADVVGREGGVMTEGPPIPVSPADSAFAELAMQLKEAHISLSTIAVGERPNSQLLDNLANWSGGKHYGARDDSQIPGLFVAETQRLLGASIVEQPFRPLVKSSGTMTDGIDLATAPMLKGFVVARPKRFSEVLLEAQKDKPLLARTQYGLGTTVAFLSDVKNRWASDWLQWPGYAQLWTQVVRSVLPHEAALLDWRVDRDGGDAVVTLRALDDVLQFRSALTPRVLLTDPDGRQDDLILRQVAPGQYQARVRLVASSTRPTRFELDASGGFSRTEVAHAGSRSVFHDDREEDRIRPPGLPLLRDLAAQTNGIYAPTPDQIFALRDGHSAGEVQIWPYLALAGLLAWLLDVIVRRAPLSPAHVMHKRRQP